MCCANLSAPQLVDVSLQVCSSGSGSGSAAAQRALKTFLGSGVVDKLVTALRAYIADMVGGWVGW